MSAVKERLPWLMLRLVPEMTRVRFYTLVDHFQSPELALGAQAQEIAALRGFNDEIARKVLEAPRTSAVDHELELMEKHDAYFITLDDDGYPENLRQCSFPPPLLYVRGTIEPQDKYSISIVGSRHATQYGKSVTQQIAARLATCGMTVVSGFARGIDSRAHDATLKAKGRTIAVLGNGLTVCYPAENRLLGEAIVANGALVSEYPMETSPDRFNFPERNRIIATLSLGTLVIEAAEKSGALITSSEALEENRFVFAIPGDINRLNSRGTNKLIQSGAKLVQRAEDMLDEMRDLLRGHLREEATGDEIDEPENGAERPPKPGNPSLTEDEQYVLNFIRHEPQYFDVLADLVDPARLPIQKLSSVLLQLELKQAIRQMPGRLYTVPV